MIEILEPLEVRDRDSSSVDVHVRDDETTSVLEDLVSGGSDGSISSLSDDPGLDLGGIALVNSFLHSSGNQDITFFIHQVLTGVRFSTREANNGSMFQLVVLQSLGINALCIVDATIPLRHTNTRGSSTCQVSAGVETHVTKSLDDVSLASPAWEVSNETHVVTLADEVVQTTEHSSTRGTGATVDSSLVDGFASDAGAGVHVRVSNCVGVGVSNPGHLSLTSPHVRSRNINSRSQETLLSQFDSKPPGDPLQLVLTVLLGINLDASLASSL